MAESAMVLAPDPILTITVESGERDRDEIHVHAGGQGYWIARMCGELGVGTTLVGPYGGEIGTLARHLADGAGLAVAASSTAGGNGAYLHDRRGGERLELAVAPPAPLSRHELDDFYGAALLAGMQAQVAVLGGPGPWDPPVVKPAFYRRLTSDLGAQGRRVVVDVSGECLRAALDGAPYLIKISHETLVADGWTGDTSTSELTRGMRALRAAGARNVIVSCADRPSLALLEDREVQLRHPHVTAVDPRGAGDSMTGAMSAGLARGLPLIDAVRLGAAAGVLNATRRGLGSGSREQIEQLIACVEAVPFPTGGT